MCPISATPFFTVSDTFNPGPKVPDGKTSICILPFDNLATLDANPFAPISINGPPPQLAAILNLCFSAAKEFVAKAKVIAIKPNTIFFN